MNDQAARIADLPPETREVLFIAKIFASAFLRRKLAADKARLESLEVNEENRIEREVIRERLASAEQLLVEIELLPVHEFKGHA